MRYLITGTAGFIGFHLARRLLEDGHEVLGVDSFSPYYDLALKEDRNTILEGYGAFRVARLALEDGPAFNAAWAAFFTVSSSSGSPLCRWTSAAGTCSRMRSRVASSRFDERPSRNSLAPSAASSRALAWAIPAEAPRMKAVWPSRIVIRCPAFRVRPLRLRAATLPASDNYRSCFLQYLFSDDRRCCSVPV